MTKNHMTGARVVVAALCAATALAAATSAAPGAASAAAASTAPADALLPPAEGTTEYPLTLTTPWGETVLDDRPERIAVIGMSPNIDVLQALDVVPVYSLGDDEPWVWRDQDWYESIEFVDTATRNDPTNFEAIAASKPDLIIATNWIFEQAEYDRLVEIAPVLDNPELVEGDQIDWQADQLLVAGALDLTAAAEASIAEAEQRVEQVAADHPEFAGKTMTVVYDYGPEWGMSYFTVTGGTAENLLVTLGFVPNPLAEQFVDDDSVSEESQAQFDADVLLVLAEDEETIENRESSELFQLVPAVSEGRYLGLVVPWTSIEGHSVWVLRRGASALSVPVAAEQFAAWATEALADA